MRQKATSKLVFTNDEDVKAKIQSRKTRPRGEKPQESSSKIRSYDFAYSFKEYIKLALAKVLPRDDTGITFIPDRQLIIGEQNLCTGLITRAMDELKNNKFVVQKINSWNDLDQVEYWLEQGAYIYRPGVIEIALKQLEKIRFFATDCGQFRDKMMRQGFMLLRIDRSKEEQVLSKVKQILSQQNSKNQHTYSELTQTYNEDDSKICQKQQNAQISKLPQDQVPKQAQSMLSSLTLSSYAITENDESMMRDSFCVYSAKKVKDPTTILESIN